MKNKPILIIEDCFDIARIPGIIVAPFIETSMVKDLKLNMELPVILKLPNGNKLKSKAIFKLSHFNPGGYQITCSLLEIKKMKLLLVQKFGYRIIH